MEVSFTIQPVAFVRNNRLEIKDDFWADVISEIELDKSIPSEAILGLSGFSHVEILFYFDQLKDPGAISFQNHPRGNTQFPLTGIFAQRKKRRPNRIGTTITKLISIADRSFKVSGLDAIDGTPVIDIKPILREFLPSETIIQPEWVTDLMKNYWATGEP